jgi:hypothetical protein
LIRARQHIPGFVDQSELARVAVVADLKALLQVEWIARWAQEPHGPFGPFHRWTSSRRMACRSTRRTGRATADAARPAIATRPMFSARGAAPTGTTYVVLDVPPEWAGLLLRWVACPGCPPDGHPPQWLTDAIQHLNDDHRWTRERIADWVEGVEQESERAVVAESAEILPSARGQDAGPREKVGSDAS